MAVLATAEAVLNAARENGKMIATAESCTGGLVFARLTEIAGSSDVMDRGFITYSNAAKQQMLGVPAALIARHGAVSEPVACAMAQGALARSDADIAVSVTGVADTPRSTRRSTASALRETSNGQTSGQKVYPK